MSSSSITDRMMYIVSLTSLPTNNFKFAVKTYAIQGITAGRGHGCSSKFTLASWLPPLRLSNRFTLVFCQLLLLSAHFFERSSHQDRAVLAGIDRTRKSLPPRLRRRSRASRADRVDRRSCLRIVSTAPLRLVFRSVQPRRMFFFFIMTTNYQ